VDTFSPLVVEWKPSTEHVSIDLFQLWNRCSEPFLIVVGHRHGVISQVNSGDSSHELEVVLVLLSIFQVVPVNPQLSECLRAIRGEVVDAFELYNFVHCQVKSV
jgi:hypothetical protein